MQRVSYARKPKIISDTLGHINLFLMSLTQRECKSVSTKNDTVRPIRNLQMCFKHPLIFIQEIFIFWDSIPNCFLRDPLLDVNPETAGITEKITERRSTGSRREMLCDLSSSLKTTLEIPYIYGRIIIQYWKSFLWSPHAILSHKTHNWLSFRKWASVFDSINWYSQGKMNQRQNSDILLTNPSLPSLFESTTHKALFSEVTCNTISSDWCHERCQEESIDSAGFSIFNGVNGHLLSSDATAALFQMEAHVTPRLIMPATSREARALCPWLLSQKVKFSS